MALADRQEIFKRIEAKRGDRRLVTFFNFDRSSTPELPGLTTPFQADSKEALFRVLKETGVGPGTLDLCLYTRGGDTNAVWPIVNLLREFDPDFQVLIPFRAHSAGTMLAMAARKVVMGPLSELSPIDPTTGNQFNPRNPTNPEQRLGISVEDVSGFFHFLRHYLEIGGGEEDDEGGLAPEHLDSLSPLLRALLHKVHPLALGNVWRVHRQIKILARKLLACHERDGQEDLDGIVEEFTSRFYSHLHMISRHEAIDVLDEDHITFADDELAEELDTLLRRYEDDFALREQFVLANHMGDEPEHDVRFAGAAIDSVARGYLYVTSGRVSQHSQLPKNTQIQLPPGQRMPLVPGLRRVYHFDVLAQGWIHNRDPQGVTL